MNTLFLQTWIGYNFQVLPKWSENPSCVFCFLETSCHSVLVGFFFFFFSPILSTTAVLQWLGDILLFTLHFLSWQNNARQPLLIWRLELEERFFFFSILLDIQVNMLARIESSRKFELKINRTNSKTSKKEMKKRVLWFVSKRNGVKWSSSSDVSYPENPKLKINDES